MIAELSPFRKFFNLGYGRLVPIVPPDAEVSPKSSLSKHLGSRGKAVGVKGSEGLWRGYNWVTADAPSEHDLDRWASMGAGVGIRTGEGLVALDIDSMDPDISQRAHAIAQRMLGTAPVRYGKRPKRLLVFSVSEPVPYMRVEFTGLDGKIERIELLSDKKQFVAEGIHPGTRRPYEWATPLTPMNELKALTRADLEGYFDELARILPQATKATQTQAAARTAINQAHLHGDIKLVAAAVAALPNTSTFAPTYDDYIRVGAAIKGATQDAPDVGLELFLEWAEKWEGGNDIAAAEADYGRIKAPYELGASWLYDKAEANSDGAFTLADVWLTPIDETPSPFDTPPAPASAKSTHNRIQLLSMAQALADSKNNARSYLIKGLIDQGAMTILYGPSNVGKTFVAMDIAFHIAAGVRYAGMRTKQKPVVYIAAEGGRGATDRVDALTRKHGHLDSPFFLVMYSVDLLRPEADLPSLIAAIDAVCPQPGLIVVDTLSRAIAGGDENSSTDMGALVANLDALRRATSAHCMVVHHSGKDAAKGARGHSLLRAATDTEIEVGDGCIKVTKQRDMDGNFLSHFKLDICQLRTDEDGDPVTSCTVAMVAAGEADPVETATPKEREALALIQMLCDTADNPNQGVTLAEILSGMQATNAETTGANVRQLVRRLGTKRLVTRSDRGCYKPFVTKKGVVTNFFEPVLDNLSKQLVTEFVTSVMC